MTRVTRTIWVKYDDIVGSGFDVFAWCVLMLLSCYKQGKVDYLVVETTKITGKYLYYRDTGHHLQLPTQHDTTIVLQLHTDGVCIQVVATDQRSWIGHD